MVDYRLLDTSNIEEAAKIYVDYYNNNEECKWTIDKARKRINQIITVKDSYSLSIYIDNQIIGFVMGFLRMYDDLLSYYLDEIVISKDEQGKDYGSALVKKLEDELLKKDVKMIELISVNDEMHKHFYEDKLGFYLATNRVCRGKFIG